MANTVTNTRLVAGLKNVVQHIVIDSDGTEETDLVIYDSSAVATVNGKTDPLNCKIQQIRYSGNSLTGFLRLEFDATTDVMAYSLAGNSPLDIDFRDLGGLKNTAGSGITGDITLTTTGLAAGDSLAITLVVDPKYPG